MAERIVDLVVKKGNLKNVKKCITDELCIGLHPFVSLDDLAQFKSKVLADFNQIDREELDYLIDTYGKEATEILNNVTEYGEKNAIEYSEYDYARNKECVWSKEDFLIRRTGMKHFYPERYKRVEEYFNSKDFVEERNYS